MSHRLKLTMALATMLLAAPLAAQAANSVSAFQTLPSDPRAVTARAVGDGKADDTAAIQSAIDSVANKGNGGVVFLPQPQTYEFTTLAELFARDIAIPKAREYVSPDRSLVLPEFRVWRQGPLDHLGWRWSDTLQTHGFVSARQGERVFFTNGSENRTFSALMGQGGRLTDLKQVANRGGESVAVDKAGKVYVANGQVFVYAADGKEVGRIDVPERPLQLIFGGDNMDRLFILTHRALYGAVL